MIPWSESAFNNSEWIKCIRGNLLFDLHSLIIIFLRSRFPLQTNNKWMIWSADDAGSIKWMCGDPLPAPRKMRSSHLSGDMDQKGRRTPALSNHPFVPRQQKRIGLWWIIPAFRCLLLDISQQCYQQRVSECPEQVTRQRPTCRMNNGESRHLGTISAARSIHILRFDMPKRCDISFSGGCRLVELPPSRDGCPSFISFPAPLGRRRRRLWWWCYNVQYKFRAWHWVQFVIVYGKIIQWKIE